MRDIRVSDITMREAIASKALSLSFKEKLEIVKILDRIGVGSIEVEGIESSKVDSLRIKSIASLVKNSTLAVPVKMDDDSIQAVWNAAKGAKHVRLQVEAAVSPSCMEYIQRKKADTLIADKQEVLAMMKWEGNPDTREWRIRMKYPKAYERMRRVIYPQMRAVDFRFNLHRRGMKQDTVYTTEVDAEYMHAVELLKKRRYEEALTILRPYEDRNTALAYMSLGYDAAAYRILRAEPDAASTPDIQYMLAILASRLGDEEQAVTYFLRSVELRESLKFRGNLDPEISRLIRKYGLFREDFE